MRQRLPEKKKTRTQASGKFSLNASQCLRHEGPLVDVTNPAFVTKGDETGFWVGDFIHPPADFTKTAFQKKKGIGLQCAATCETLLAWVVFSPFFLLTCLCSWPPPPEADPWVPVGASSSTSSAKRRFVRVLDCVSPI